MSKVVVFNKVARAAERPAAGPVAQPLREENRNHVLVDCVEEAMDTIAARVRLLRRHDQRVSANSPWTWKQLTRIENRLEELQIALKTVRKRPR